MDFAETKELCNTDTNEETIALQKKRSRRVSFAENTEVHVFDRDEEYETPSNSRPTSDSAELDGGNDVVGFLKNLRGSNEENEEEGDDTEADTDAEGQRKSFLRPTESPSPGSTVGSATSNDEDNFFGPVSASFIRPGRLSDSAASDENRDITMDSTSFSMKFHSLAKSDSGVDLKTPTGVHLTFEDKTPTQNSISASAGSTMVFTGVKKPTFQSYIGVDKFTGGSDRFISGDSNDMSLVGENPHRYDYGRLSPGLNALLQEGNSHCNAVSSCDDISSTKTPNNKNRQNHRGRTEVANIDSHGSPYEVVTLAKDRSREANIEKAPASDDSMDLQKHPPTQLAEGIPFTKHKEASGDAEADGPKLELSAPGKHTLSNSYLSRKTRSRSPISGFMSSLSTNRHSWIVTPSGKQSGSFSNKERRHSESLLSIRKSISKFKVIEASLFGTTLDVGDDIPNLGSSYHQNLLTVAQITGEEKNTINCSSNVIDSLVPKKYHQNLRDATQTEDTSGPTTYGDALNRVSTSVQGNNEVVSIALGQDGDLKEDTDLHNLQKGCDTIGNAHMLSEDQCSQFCVGQNSQTGPDPSRHIKELSMRGLKIGNNSSGRKRRNEEVVLTERSQMDEIARILRSPKVRKAGHCDSKMDFPDESNKGTYKSERLITLKHWLDIFSKFSGDTKEMLSSMLDKLDIQAIVALEDILVQLQKAKVYEIICKEIGFQKRLNSFSNHQYLRQVEISLLLHNIIYEQAKLQLLRRKQTTLVKMVQSLSCGNQKFKMLKLNLFKQVSRAMGAQFDDYHPQSVSVKVEQVASAKVAAMRQEFEALDSQVKNLTKSFHAICKLEGEPSWDDTIRLVNDHLKKITCCRFIRQDLQLWKVDYLESSDGLYNVFLNYRGFIFQRFTIDAGKDSNVVISNKFNDIKIMKNFPDMDASTAFAFVLNAETCQKYVGPRILAQQTQVSSSLLCNLVDVFDEVLLARILLPSLAQTRFHSPSAGHLDLQLGFVDLNSGWKVNLTLDMTCLNRGVYPLDIVPYKLWANKGTAGKSMAQSISADIWAAVGSLQIGYSRIMRLCRSVCHIVQTSILQ